jgi:hypothetical protein
LHIVKDSYLGHCQVTGLNIEKIVARIRARGEKV